ncbi:g11408 [Coccomyxa elongata]
MAAALAAFATVPQGLRANRGLTTTVKTRSVSLVSKLTSKRKYGLQQCSATPTLAREALAAPPVSIDSIAEQLKAAGGPKERAQLLLELAKSLPPFPADARTMANRVMGCTAQVWVDAELNSSGRVQFSADSDSDVTRGLAAVLVTALSGLTPAQVLEVEPEDLAELQLGPAVLTPSRTNGFLNMLEAMRKRARVLSGAFLPTFPSLRVSADAIDPQGTFAIAQAKYLEPDPAQVDALVKVLSEKRIGLVAHFYMDPQVQGVLSAAAERWPHIHISDSLVMADSAVRMAEAGCTSVAVLGVDFMSENVRAILDEAGHADVAVYRMAAADIGCSLAEAAEAPAYSAYLGAAAGNAAPALHVVYINTSLRTKALAHAQVPTITCTSSNVVQTVLQAFAQVPGINVYYGPDTYMGANLAVMLRAVAQMSDEEIRALHPEHNRESVRALLPRLHYFESGTCIVHHLFGAEVSQLLREAYGDAYLTAHFEVPGEMFALAMEAKKRGMGVVGSTQNILDFIAAKLAEAVERPFPDTLQVVLGTESGMVTAIVRKVQAMLRAAGRLDVTVEIVFPVASEAITTSANSPADPSQGASAGGTLPGGLPVVPGPAGGEGCSAEGGCASCPYMKMNSLDALLGVCAKIGTPGEALLEAFRPRAYTEPMADGRSIAAAGCEPILYMRGFQASKRLPDALVADILSRKHA